MAVRENLRKGMRAAWAGRRAEALDAFRAVLREDPLNETAFLWLRYLVDGSHGRLACITCALRVYLQNCRAYAVLWWAWRRVIGLPAGAASLLSPSRRRWEAHPVAVGRTGVLFAGSVGLAKSPSFGLDGAPACGRSGLSLPQFSPADGHCPSHPTGHAHPHLCPDLDTVAHLYFHTGSHTDSHANPQPDADIISFARRPCRSITFPHPRSKCLFHTFLYPSHSHPCPARPGGL